MTTGDFAPTDQTVATYEYLVERLDGLPLSHLQVLRAPSDLTGTPIEALQDAIGFFRARYRGTLIANFGFDKASANATIESDQADLVSFAKPYVANPDLVRPAAGRPAAQRFGALRNTHPDVFRFAPRTRTLLDTFGPSQKGQQSTHLVQTPR